MSADNTGRQLPDSDAESASGEDPAGRGATPRGGGQEPRQDEEASPGLGINQAGFIKDKDAQQPAGSKTRGSGPG